MSKRFKAKIDWEDSGWVPVGLYCYHRSLGKRWLLMVWKQLENNTWYYQIDLKRFRIADEGSGVFFSASTSRDNAKQACIRALRRLLK